MNLQIRVDEKEGRQYVMLAGEVDAYTAPKLRETLLPLTENRHAETILDLTDVNYMDSTGLGVIIGALKSVKAHEGTLKLTGSNKRVSRLFEITGLTEVIEIDPVVRGGN